MEAFNRLAVNPIFLIPILTGSVFLIAGIIMLKFPPKTINTLYGYRTAASMQSQERWEFAQRYSAIKLVQIGLILMVIALIGCFYNLPNTFGVIAGPILLLAGTGILFYKTEGELRVRFK